MQDRLDANLRVRGAWGSLLEDTFDVTVTGRTEAGETVSQDVFVDTNG